MRTAVVSHAVYDRLLRTGSDLLGMRVQVGLVTATIVGVAPPRFIGTDITKRPALFLPLESVAEVIPNGASRLASPGAKSTSIAWLEVWTGTDASKPKVEAHLNSDPRYSKIARRIALEPFDSATVPGAIAERLTTLSKLLGVVFFLLLVAGVVTTVTHVTNTTVERHQALAVMTALGARPWQVRSEALALGTTICLGATLMASVIAKASLHQLDRIAASGAGILPAGADFYSASVLGPVLSLGALITVVTGIAAIRTARVDEAGVSTILRQDRSKSPHRLKGQGVVVASGIALMIVLSSATLGLVDLTWKSTRIDVGFEPDGLVSTLLDFSATAMTPRDIGTATSSVLDVLHRGSRTAFVTAGAGGVNQQTPLTLDSIRFNPTGNVSFLAVNPTYFEGMKIRPLRGRLPYPLADNVNWENQVVVSESFARMLPGSDPIGKRLSTLSGFGGVVIGVIKDVTLDLTRPTSPMMFVALSNPLATLSVRRRLYYRVDDIARGIEATVSAVASVNRRILPVSSETVHSQLRRQIALPMFSVQLLLALSAGTVFLTVVAIYVLTSAVIHSRRFEFAMRIVLGAAPRALVAVTLRSTFTPVAVGIALGTAMSLVGLRWLEILGATAALQTTRALAAAIILCMVCSAIATVGPLIRLRYLQPSETLRQW